MRDETKTLKRLLLRKKPEKDIFVVMFVARLVLEFLQILHWTWITIVHNLEKKTGEKHFRYYVCGQAC